MAELTDAQIDAAAERGQIARLTAAYTSAHSHNLILSTSSCVSRSFVRS